MIRMGLALGLGVMLGVAGFSIAGHNENGHGQVTILSERDILERIDGKAARATVVEVAYEPGEASLPHRHAGPIFGYVLEGEYELGLADEPARRLKPGDTFYEPTGIRHRVSRNPSPKTRTRILAVLVHDRDVKETTTPAPETK